MTATMRRRNQYADNCYVCRKEVPVGEGWLYCDTKSQRSRGRHRAGFGWKKQVKCNRCHEGNVTNKYQADALDNPKPAEPVVRPWSITQVKKWVIEVREIEIEGKKDIAILVNGEVVSCRDRIGAMLCVPSDCQLEEFGILGKPLSRSAVQHIFPLLYAEIKKIHNAEKEASERAWDLMQDRGINVEDGTSNVWFRFKTPHESGCVYGRYDGSVVVSGISIAPISRWFETTLEEFLK